MAATAAADEVHRIVSVALDAAFYRAAYPDVAALGADPLKHYLEAGWREGRDPAPWFCSSAYLADNPDVRRAKVEPFFHYLMHGRREGREVTPSAAGERYLLSSGAHGWSFEALQGASEAAPEEYLGPSPEQLAEERRLIAPEFDAAFYLQANPDVAEAGQDPLDHFLVTGWLEGRDPSRRFSVRDYLDTYPDVAGTGMNPFVHYVRAGRSEGRIPRNELGFRYQLLADLRPVAIRTAEVAARAAARTPTPPARLTKALSQSRSGLRDLHVTFSHDDYSANLGGVQLCLQREDARVAGLGGDHLHLYPADPWPVVRESKEPGLLGVLWNGERVGAFKPKVVAAALKAAAQGVEPGRRTFAIHSLLGHSAEETADILAVAGLRSGWFWLHDFASLCAGYHLLRNDVQDCAAPPPGSPACSVCSYYSHRQRHLDAHRHLFERLDLTVVAPSQPTLDLWMASGVQPAAKAVVLPHAKLVERGAAPVPRPGPLRIAYAGLPSAHKGWPLFCDLVLRHEADDRYTFLHLGSRAVAGLPLEFHEVAVNETNPRAMQEALETAQADVVILWPLCRETFSFTAYEAIAAGCAVVTGPDSGNVQAFVRDGGHGWVLADEAALARALDDGSIGELGRATRRPRLYDLTFSNLTVDLFEAAAG
ncbi:glycosyltransferase [Phenylobacterium sp. VNQ135]|uniref:glycosyltransferase n=1 Tax=Phenylobacterium sp. VNQ135 TaxID=3400922 RepID=UPI003C0854EE